MPIIIEKKKGYITGMVAIELTCVAAIIFLIYKLAGSGINNSKTIVFGLGAIFCIIIALISFLDMLFIPIGVSIDEEENQISFNYLFSRTKTIAVKDISAFCTTTLKSKSTTYSGLIIYLPQSKQIMVSDYSLDNYSPVQWFLEKKGVQNNGEKGFSKISYVINQLINR
jgi:hypothetical protein